MTDLDKTNGICGLSCSEDCLNFTITKRNDRAEMVEAAEQWSIEDGKEYSVEDIICHGCWEEDDRVSSSARECKIRRCAKQRGHYNCGSCEDHPCETLKELFRRYSDSMKDMVHSLTIPK